MPFFPNIELEIWKLETTINPDDIYGDEQFSYILDSVVPADIQELNRNDMLEEFGRIIQDTYKIYLNSNVQLNNTTILRIKGKLETYKIIGEPSLNNHLIPVTHIRLFIERERKPTKLMENVDL